MKGQGGGKNWAINHTIHYWLGKYKKSLSLSLAALAVITGVLPLLFIPELISLNATITCIFIITLFLIFYMTNRMGKFISLVIISFLWGNWHCIDIKNKMNFLSEKNHIIDLTVISIPLAGKEYKHKIRIDRINSKIIFPPLYALWKTKEPLCAGQSWQIVGKLKPLHSSLNEGGRNQQRYLLAKRQIGLLKSQQQKTVDSQCSIRQKLINYYSQQISPLNNAGIIYALMFGERGLLTPQHSLLLQSTGLTHLIAISGLHIGLAYLFGYLIVRGIQYLLPISFLNESIPILSGVCLAVLYAWVSDFAIPATRAFFALLLWVYIRKKTSHYFSWQWALWSIAGILVLDPLSILSDSFWLSSFAVLAILYWSSVLPLSPHLAQQKVIGKIIILTHLQIGLLILLIPMQLIMFNGINLMNFFANLWFVPIISWLVVPAIFILFLLPIPEIQNVILLAIDQVIEWGLKPIPFFSRFWFELRHVPYYALVSCWLIALVILYRWYKNYVGLCGCVLILILTERGNSKSPEKDWSLTVLDIGHGLAVVIEQNNLAFLYDTGNIWKGSSSAKKQVIPFLKHHNITPLTVILSHNHLDHTGGVKDLSQQYPWISMRSSFGNYSNEYNKLKKRQRMQHLPCFKGQKWQWGVLTFEVLWPEKLSKISHNNDSCVIQLTDGYHKILLTGDLEKQGERSIVEMYKSRLHSNILFAPHHGSSTSSTALLLRNVKPSLALVSSARYSAWKIPSQKVYSRYKSSGVKWLNTAENGQITLWFKKENIKILRYRYEIQPRWYHLWFGLPLFPE